MRFQRSMSIASRSTFIAATLVGVVGLASSSAKAAATNTVSFGGTYSDNFDDLPTASASINAAAKTISPAGQQTSTATTTAIDSFQNDFGFTGTTGTGAWYAGTSGTAIQVGAHPGDNTTGGVIDFGANSSTANNRALGLLATSSNGDTTFGVELINSTSSPITSINLSFLGEKFRDGKTSGVQKSLNFAYLQVPAASTASSTLPVATGTTGLTQVPAFSFTTTSAGGNAAVDPTQVTNQFSKSGTLTLGSTWNVGDGLWLTWQMPAAVSSGDGLAIDNLVVSVPEPATLSLIGLGGLTMLRRRQA